MKQLLTKKTKSSVVENEIKEVKREWRNFLRFNGENRLLFAALIVVLCSFLIVNALLVMSGMSTNSTNDTPEQARYSSQYVTSHYEGKNGALKARISNVTENNQKDPAFTIDPSETMLIMDVSITNTTSSIQHLIPSTQLYVRSDEGDYAQLHASMFVTNPLPAKDLVPNETVTGQISFNVPKRVAMPLVYIDTGWNNFGPVVFDALH